MIGRLRVQTTLLLRRLESQYIRNEICDAEYRKRHDRWERWERILKRLEKAK